MKDPFKIYEAKGTKAPIILSIPHAGTKFPKALKKHYKKRMQQQIDDTDWYVDRLYKFAQNMGITIIKAKYSRWVIDLNRDPESTPLYNDGRIITGLTSTTDFFGNDIYRKKEFNPDHNEINRRLDAYYWPYYKKVTALLDERKTEFGIAILWDAHSIRDLVPTIQKEKFPDLILGNNDHATAYAAITNAAIEGLNSGDYQLHINTPFKGGHITRYFGKPAHNIHALQLEMNKILYMDNRELNFVKERADKIRTVLKTTLEGLINTANRL
jgi:N-formylglutamate deformylase